MSAEQTTLIMLAIYLLGFVMTVAGGIAFLRRNPLLLNSGHVFANGVILSCAGAFFIGGAAVHFTGSSNTAFLRGQRAQTSSCELDRESAHPEARHRSGAAVIGPEIVACMQAAGYAWTDELAQCKEAPLATNSYCYLPAAWFDRGVTRVQIAFD